MLASTARHFQGGPLSALWYRSYTPLAHAAHRAGAPAEAMVRWRVDRRVRGQRAGPLDARRARAGEPRWAAQRDAVGGPLPLEQLDRRGRRARLGGDHHEGPHRPGAASAASPAAIPGAAPFEVAGPTTPSSPGQPATCPVLGEAVDHAATTAWGLTRRRLDHDRTWAAAAAIAAAASATAGPWRAPGSVAEAGERAGDADRATSWPVTTHGRAHRRDPGARSPTLAIQRSAVASPARMRPAEPDPSGRRAPSATIVRSSWGDSSDTTHTRWSPSRT